MLAYLVTSKARRNLLSLLWKDGASGSVQEFARLAHVSYGAAHNELTAMEKNGLAVSKGDGRSVVFSANRSFSQAQLLRRLVSETRENTPQSEDRGQDVVLANLKKLGAPLSSTAETDEELQPEEALARALVLSRKNATVLRVLPFLFSHLVGRLDFAVVRKRAGELRQGRGLGFVLEVAATLSHNPELRKEARLLLDKRVKHDEYYFVNTTGSFAQALARKNTPALAKKWHFVLNMPLDSFRGVYEKNAVPS